MQDLFLCNNAIQQKESVHKLEKKSSFLLSIFIKIPEKVRQTAARPFQFS